MKRILLLIALLPLLAMAKVQVPFKVQELRVGDKVYTDVTVKKLNPESMLIMHSKGIAQVYLRDLEPEMQEYVGYNAVVEKAYSTNRKRILDKAEENTMKAKEEWNAYREEQQAGDSAKSRYDRAIAKFGEKPVIKDEVDFSNDVIAFAKGDEQPIVKQQGRSPSCAVFAVVGALELQYARTAKEFRRFSESYLIWGTQKVTGKTEELENPKTFVDPNESKADEDAGFALRDVLNALTKYGAAREKEMPYKQGQSFVEIPEPSEELIEKSSTEFVVVSQPVPGSGQARIENIIHLLNEGVPVVVGVKWPHFRGIMHGTISLQSPRDDYRHAVVLYGYRKDDKPGKVEFYFKNSYGQRWGKQGYGWFSQDYLAENLSVAYVLNITLPSESSEDS